MRCQITRLACLVVAMATRSAVAGPITIAYAEPTYDRWNYQFNATPGFRTSASTFGATGEILFDDRDGQFLVSYDTSADVAPGQGPASYEVLRATLILEVANDLVFIYDDTVDPYQVFLEPDDPDLVEDTDAGQPIELFGSGFRDGWDAASYGENGPFGPSGPGVRNAFPLAFEESAVDVSNSVIEAWTPTPWAIGTIDAVSPGMPVPAGTDVAFDVNVNDPDIQAYLQSSMNDGVVSFMVTSLTLVVQGEGPFPSFFTKENPLVIDGFAQAARLELEVLVGSSCDEDVDGSGVVDFADLVPILSSWGSCVECDEDIDGNGAVDFGDLVRLLSAWGDCP